FRVVAAVNPSANTLYWIHPNPERRRPRHRALAGFDANQPIRIERVDYDLAVRESGRLVSVITQLSPVPAAQRYMSVVLAEPEYRVQDNLPAVPPSVAVAAAELLPDEIPELLDVQAGVFLPLAGGRDGLALLRPQDFIGEPSDPSDDEDTKLS